MAKLSSVHSRRLRSVAVAGLIVGTTGAFFSGGHANQAHAAGSCSGALMAFSGSGFAAGSNTLLVTGYQGVDSSLNPSPSRSEASNIMTVKLTGTSASSTGCFYTATIQNDGTFHLTSDSAIAVGTYKVTTVNETSNDAQAATGVPTGPPNDPTACSNPSVDGTLPECTTLRDGGGATNKNVNVPCNVDAAYYNNSTTTNNLSMPGTTTFDVANGTASLNGTQVCSGLNVNINASVHDFSANTTSVSGNGSTATPELGSGELLATGLVPALGIVLYRRRRQRRAAK